MSADMSVKSPVKNFREGICDNILDAVGSTPLVRLNRLFSEFPETTVLGKVEFMNPNGSMKDRIGKRMIERAEAEGLIKPGDTLVEPTSGNTGLGIAMAAAAKGYKLIITMPLKMSEEKRRLLRAFGAELILTPTEYAFDFVTPGSFFINGLVLKLSQNSIIALRIVALMCLTTCAGVTLKLGKNHLPKIVLIILSLLFWYIHIPITLQVSHHLWSTTFGLMGVYSAALYVQHHHQQHAKKWVLSSGILTGLSLLCTQSLGILLLITLSGYLLIYQKFQQKHSSQTALTSTCIWFLLPALLPLFITTLWLLLNGALDDFWHSTVVWLFKGGYSKTTSHWYFGEGLAKILAPLPEGKLYIAPIHEIIKILLHGSLPILGLLWGIQIIWQQKQQQGIHWYFLLLWLSAFCFMAASMSFPNRVMVAYHGWLAYLLSAMALYNLLKSQPKTSKISISLFLILCLFWTKSQLMRTLAMVFSPQYISYGTLEPTLSPLPGTPNADINWQNAVVEKIHQRTLPHDYFFTYNLEPQLYLLTNRHNPTRFQYVLHTYNTPQQIHEVAADLSEKRPTYILYDQKDSLYFQYDRRFSKLKHMHYTLTPIEAVIREKYTLINAHQHLRLYQLNQQQ